MKELFPVGCVIMASGLSRRFGSNKLLADFCGEPVLCRAFSATDMPQLAARIVVTRSAEVQSLCRQHEVPVLLHSLPGRNDTVRLGLSHLLEQRPDLAGCMFLPGDQPLLTRSSVEAVIAAFRADGSKEAERKIFRLGARIEENGASLAGSPVLFGNSFFPELLALPEGKGGSVLLRKYPEAVRTVSAADRAELLDADTPETLEQLKTLAFQKR